MKTVLTIILFTITCYSVHGQEVYPFVMKALKHVDKYYYEQMSIPHVSKNVSAYGEIPKKEQKIISDRLNASGFEFDRLTDTLLIVLSYENHVVGPGPFFIYAQSSQSKKALKCESYRTLTYVERSPAEQYAADYYSLLYSGTVLELKKLVSQRGRFFGAGRVALRIIIQNGVVVDPSFLWHH